MNEFKIINITAMLHDSSYGGYPWKTMVRIEIDSKWWARIRKANGLGMLYGVDISNAVGRINSNIRAYQPTVDDQSRARKGIKTITLTYFSQDYEAARKIGFNVKICGGEPAILDYGKQIEIEIPKQKEAS